MLLPKDVEATTTKDIQRACFFTDAIIERLARMKTKTTTINKIKTTTKSVKNKITTTTTTTTTNLDEIDQVLQDFESLKQKDWRDILYNNNNNIELSLADDEMNFM